MIAATPALMNTRALGKHKNAVTGASPANCQSTESHFCLRSRHRWELGGDTSERFCLFTVKLAQRHPARVCDGKDRHYYADLKRISVCFIEHTFLSLFFNSVTSLAIILMPSSCEICENVITLSIMVYLPYILIFECLIKDRFLKMLFIKFTAHRCRGPQMGTEQGHVRLHTGTK